MARTTATWPPKTSSIASVVIPAATETTRLPGFSSVATSFRVSRIRFGFTAKITSSAPFTAAALAAASFSREIAWTPWLEKIESALVWVFVVTRMLVGVVPD